MTYADIIIDISHEALDKSFQYIIPKELEPAVSVGSVVSVPFGRGNTRKRAYVIGISGTPKIEESKLKEILEIDTKDVSVEGRLISLAFWLARTYGATFASAFRTVLPVAKKASLPKKKTVRLLNVSIGEEYLSNLVLKKNHSVAKRRLLEALIRDGELPWEIITQKLNIASINIRDLEKKKVIEVCEQDTHYSFSSTLSIEQKNVILNSEQKAAVEDFNKDWENGIRGKYLIHGVTGSGKTEVYIRMLETVINDGKEAIVLIPEIALTYQTLMRFIHRFGDKVSVMNSRLSTAERYDIFERAKKGDIKIIVGPRSALFTPFKNLGLIIIDEEHETSYKSEKMPRYHARECAAKRAELDRASLVLGSATPSVESFYEAKTGKKKLYTLNNRATGQDLAKTKVIDLRNELKAGNRSIISRTLHEEIEKNLNDKKQTMLFINRRGMLACVSCRSCGEVIKCPHCDISLSLHRDGKLYCHYCGHVEEKPKNCPSCGSKYIGGFKAGTEKIEEEVKRLFPKARVLRMDADSTKGKDGHEKILSVFSNGGADILIGTQMIVKGHDFPDVTLVGILAADLSLNTGDYRSAERTFDLITQAVGRAGRAESGRAIIQTYRPDHYAIAYSATQDYIGFYEKEIEYRKLFSYPPVGHLLLVMILSKKEAKTKECGELLNKHLIINQNTVWMSNSVAPAVSKIQDVHRRMMYFKAQSIDELYEIRLSIENICKDNRDVSIYFDLDPISM